MGRPFSLLHTEPQRATPAVKKRPPRTPKTSEVVSVPPPWHRRMRLVDGPLVEAHPSVRARATRDAALGASDRRVSLHLVPSSPQCAMITVDHCAAGRRTGMGQVVADPREDGRWVAQRPSPSRRVGQGSANKGSATVIKEAVPLYVTARDRKEVSICHPM